MNLCVAAGDDVANTRVRVWLMRPMHTRFGLSLPLLTFSLQLFLLTHRFISAPIALSDKLVRNSVEVILTSLESAT